MCDPVGSHTPTPTHLIEVPDPITTQHETKNPIHLLYKRGPTTLGCIA